MAEKVPYLLTHYDINDIVVAMLRNVIDNRYWDWELLICSYFMLRNLKINDIT